MLRGKGYERIFYSNIPRFFVVVVSTAVFAGQQYCHNLLLKALKYIFTVQQLCYHFSDHVSLRFTSLLRVFGARVDKIVINCDKFSECVFASEPLRQNQYLFTELRNI